MNPWDTIIPQHEQEAYRAAGFGRRAGLGKRPALLIIDVQYRTVGTEPRPFMEAIKEFPTACGEVGWNAVRQIARVLALFRSRNWPVLYPYVSPKESFDTGRLADKVPALMTVAKHGYDFVAEIAPEKDDVLLPKKHPSAFFGTPLVSYLMSAASTPWSSPAARRAAACAAQWLTASPTISAFSCRTSASTTEARFRMRSTSSTCRRNTRTW